MRGDAAGEARVSFSSERALGTRGSESEFDSFAADDASKLVANFARYLEKAESVAHARGMRAGQPFLD